MLWDDECHEGLLQYWDLLIKEYGYLFYRDKTVTMPSYIAKLRTSGEGEIVHVPFPDYCEINMFKTN